ncbi:hypothetical protein C7457_0813 [Thermovibrio guaymasensis]|uniref:Uncharacterized protein n=1 Tax=Thermovibrio guaymasensis TaxID=240167 RepID=A0A420W9H7_9BACT|nr:hypothetical protein [Thermovibrio guaymasensis]RKQ63925.1 hypothetical protein C7457_0813 [Thermovibrio guaymasensis]
MRLYLGYPDSVGESERFRLKDLFLKEVSVDYSSVPVEVKKKLLSLLDNVDKKRYLFLGEVLYDGIDILEFALFGVNVRDYDELVLPGYLYGKPTHLIKNLLKDTFGKRFPVVYDFNLFDRNTIVVNVGYTRSSISFGGKLLTVISLGEFHFIDFFGNYLFNRFLGETGISNAKLRKEGVRGDILDKCRSQAARILFGRTSKVEIPQFNYSRPISKEEIDLVLSPLTGSANYGELIEKAADFSSAVVNSLYTYEELFRERPKVKDVKLIGRLTFPFERSLKKIFPIKVEKVKEEELLKRGIVNKTFKVVVEKPSFKAEVLKLNPLQVEGVKGGIRELRHFFRSRDPKGLPIIERLTEELKGKELEDFAYELITVIKRSSFRRKEEVAYLNHSIAALTRLELPESLLKKAVKEIERRAFNWQLPFETKVNILYFCYRNREKLRGSNLEVFPFLMLTYIRNKKVTEGEKNFVRTVCEKFYLS